MNDPASPTIDQAGIVAGIDLGRMGGPQCVDREPLGCLDGDHPGPVDRLPADRPERVDHGDDGDHGIGRLEGIDDAPDQRGVGKGTDGIVDQHVGGPRAERSETCSDRGRSGCPAGHDSIRRERGLIDLVGGDDQHDPVAATDLGDGVDRPVDQPSPCEPFELLPTAEAGAGSAGDHDRPELHAADDTRHTRPRSRRATGPRPPLEM